jgi:hypothetical protein
MSFQFSIHVLSMHFCLIQHGCLSFCTQSYNVLLKMDFCTTSQDIGSIHVIKHLQMELIEMFIFSNML